MSGFLISMMEQRTFLPYFLVSSSLSFLMSSPPRPTNHAGTCALDHDLDFVVLALDLDRRNACRRTDASSDPYGSLVVFHEEVAKHIVLSGPTGSSNS